ncbi:hypothetical protein FPK15_contig00056-0013 [Flavobacterium psychrophilum]|nr:hypothetical protein FPK15_contig00056-0013 [Flavobacterium psychrophilum]
MLGVLGKLYDIAAVGGVQLFATQLLLLDEKQLPNGPVGVTVITTVSAGVNPDTK